MFVNHSKSDLLADVSSATVHNGAWLRAAPGVLICPRARAVRVEALVVDESGRKARVGRLRQLAQRLDGLPEDLAKNHDHYLYGTPKR